MDVSSHFRDFPAILTGGKCIYGKLQWMGQGVFGTVILYRQWGTMNQVAVKFLDKFRGLEESKILEKIKKYDPDKNNLLKLKEHFEFNLDYCIISEKLDQDILHYMCDITLEPLTVSEIRPIAQQLLVALKALKSYGIVHTDIKPDNIMFVNHEKYPFKVKLIDFGLARNVFDLNRMTLIQPLGYRAPEVVFGLPKDESVDMWGLGCSLAFMYLLRNLYPKTSVYEYIATIIQMQGTLPDYVIQNALWASEFFVCNGNHFKFKTPSEYVGDKGKMTDYNFMNIGTLDDRLNINRRTCVSLELQDEEEFRSLLKQMLCVNSKDRITPEEALRHDFITMKHLSKRKEHYATLAHNLMSVCQDTERTDLDDESVDGESSTDISTSEKENAYKVQKQVQNTPKKLKPIVIHVKPCRPVDDKKSKRPHKVEDEINIKTSNRIVDGRKSTETKTSKNKRVPLGAAMEKFQRPLPLPVQNSPKKLKPRVSNVKPCCPVDKKSKKPRKVEDEINIKTSNRIVDGRRSTKETKTKLGKKKRAPPDAAVKKSQRPLPLPVQNAPKKLKPRVIHVKPCCPVDDKSKRPHKVEDEINIKSSNRIIDDRKSSKEINMKALTKTKKSKKRGVPPGAAVEKSQHPLPLPVQNTPKKLKPRVIHVKPCCPVDDTKSKKPHKVEDKINIKTSNRIVDGRRSKETKTSKKKKVPPSAAMEKFQRPLLLPVQNSPKKLKPRASNVKPCCPVDKKSKKPHKVEDEINIKDSGINTETSTKKRVPPCAAAEKSQRSLPLPGQNSPKKQRTQKSVENVESHCPVDDENDRRSLTVAEKVKALKDMVVSSMSFKKVNKGGEKRPSAEEKTKPSFLLAIRGVFMRLWPASKKK